MEKIDTRGNYDCGHKESATAIAAPGWLCAARDEPSGLHCPVDRWRYRPVFASPPARPVRGGDHKILGAPWPGQFRGFLKPTPAKMKPCGFVRSTPAGFLARVLVSSVETSSGVSVFVTLLSRLCRPWRILSYTIYFASWQSCSNTDFALQVPHRAVLRAHSAVRLGYGQHSSEPSRTCAP